MIVTHVFSLFYSGNSFFWEWWIWWGATVCFTIFLFVFASLYGKKISSNSLQPVKEILRMGWLLLSYFLIGLYVQLFLSNLNIDHFGKYLIPIFTLEHLPGLTEFILTFALYIGLIIAFHQFLQKLISNVWVTLLSSFLVYWLSRHLYELNTPFALLQSLKAQLVGHADLHAFGILSYFPVFAIGLWWGTIFDNESLKNKLLPIFSITCLGALTILYVTDLSDWGRWPPTVLFLLYGLTFSFVMWWLNSYIQALLPKIFHFIQKLGRHALIYYLGHILIIMPLWFLIKPNSTTPWLALIILTGTIGLITAFLAWQQGKALTRTIL
jgi:hypothetical protein